MKKRVNLVEKTSLNVRIPKELKEKLKEYAENSGVTLEELAQAVFEHIVENNLPVRKKVEIQF